MNIPEHVGNQLFQGVCLEDEQGSEGARLCLCHKGVVRTHPAGVVIGLSTAVTLMTQVVALDAVHTFVPLTAILRVKTTVKPLHVTSLIYVIKH